MPEFVIDPDIRKAKTLSSGFYTGESYFDASKEKIFARTWHCAGTTGEVDNLRPITLLPGVLDEPVVFVKNSDEINCLSNVCTHRGKVLVEEPGAAGLIRCGYHGRRFDLSGRFLSMPEFDGVEDFPAETDNLRRVPFAVCGDFLFAAVSPLAPFEDFVGNAVTLFDGPALKLTSTRDYEVNAHWALYCENYLEGFHIPFVHRSLNEVVDYGTYSTETFRFSSIQTGFDSEGEVAGRYLFIFPNLMFNFYPWGVSVN